MLDATNASVRGGTTPFVCVLQTTASALLWILISPLANCCGGLVPSEGGFLRVVGGIEGDAVFPVNRSTLVVLLLSDEAIGDVVDAAAAAATPGADALLGILWPLLEAAAIEIN